MKPIFASILIATLAGCAQNAAPPPTLAPIRDPSAQIASQTDVTAERLAGDWVIRQSFAGQVNPADALSLTALSNGALQMVVRAALCPPVGCITAAAPVVLAATGPGRWTPAVAQNAPINAELWVMWLDFDNRTAAIGSPSGDFGWIMDRSATGGADRIVAARDIMDWFGYDVARLNAVQR